MTRYNNTRTASLNPVTTYVRGGPVLPNVVCKVKRERVGPATTLKKISPIIIAAKPSDIELATN